MEKKWYVQVFKYLLFGLSLYLFGWSSLVVNASELPPGVVVGDDNGIKAQADGKYFIEHNNIKPGMTFEKNITISNYGQEETPFDLKMTMKKDQVTGDINLLEAITVTLVLEGKEIYKGDLTGKATDKTTKMPLDLGQYKVGDSKNLKATFVVSDDVPKEKWNKPNQADFYWGFYATKAKKKDDQKKEEDDDKKRGLLPKTGEQWALVIISALIGAVLIVLVLSEVKKRQAESK